MTYIDSDTRELDRTYRQSEKTPISSKKNTLRSFCVIYHNRRSKISRRDWKVLGAIKDILQE